MPPRLIDTRWLWLLCSFQGPPRGRLRRPVDNTCRPAGTGLSKLNSMHGLELGECRTAREGAVAARTRGTAAGPARSGRRSSCTVGDRRGGSRRRRPRPLDGAVPYRPLAQGLPRKEVIQPHLPVRLPCYDFTPVTSPTFDGSLPEGLGHRLRVLLTPVV